MDLRSEDDHTILVNITLYNESLIMNNTKLHRLILINLLILIKN